ncbi:MAG TPA: hypothetical protein ENJ95_15210 [Bacteroidetes bacterium]|nr:hypothetical protein [Bacteroidota bacterium]
MRVSLLTSFFVLFGCPYFCGAQPAMFGQNEQVAKTPFANAKKTESKIVIDGNIDEAAWYSGVPADNFWQLFPTDSVMAELQTEIFFTYDDDNFYVAAKCYAPRKEYVVPSLRRDFRAGGSDNLTFLFDTFNDETNAFFFGTNPAGVLREGLISNGGANRQDFSGSWDNKWTGTAKIHDGYWAAEMAIPFKTVRYQEGSTKWRFNAYRFDTQITERSSWTRIPQNQFLTNLAFMGDLNWEEPLKKSGANFAVIPYVSADMSRDFEESGSGYNKNFNFGGDAKVAITSGLNLDLTINPDFSQVEVDRQVTNLQRFEIFFPERRQFFLENADLFGSFGDRRINPFFSRRIGVAKDTATGATIQNPIYFGARLSGKLDENWRVGLLSMQTADDGQNDLPSFNYTVAAIQRKLFARSNVGLIFVNKQALNNKETQTYNLYNRIIGLDYNLATTTNTWSGKAYVHKAITPENAEDKLAHGLRLGYRVRHFALTWRHSWVGEGYDAEVGFVPRKDFFQMRPQASYFFYPSNGKVVQHGPSVEALWLVKPGYGNTDREFRFRWTWRMRNSSRFQAEVKNEYTFLFDDFDPTREGNHYLPEGAGYTYTNYSLQYNSDRSQAFSFRIEPRFGEFFNGHRLGLRGDLTYRFQPYGNIALNYNLNRIKLAAPFTPVNLYLVGPRIDLTFTKKIFLTTFIQYNSQIDNLNINARFQWRFKPVSDFFLVYTDNYFPEDFRVKNRAVVAKLTYWLNM